MLINKVRIMSSYTTKYLKRDEYDKWDELVSQSPAANIFDTTLWLDTVLFKRELLSQKKMN
jgi:hypothetical protein